MSTLWSLAQAKKSCNNINNSRALVSRPCYFLWLSFDSVSLKRARNSTEIRKTIHSPRRKKKYHVNYKNTWYKVRVFPLSVFSFLFTYYFVTKKYLHNIPYRKLLLNCKQHSKIRKEHVLIKCPLFNKVLLYCKDMVKPITSKVFTESKKQQQQQKNKKKNKQKKHNNNNICS